jgi:hypothetical protein
VRQRTGTGSLVGELADALAAQQQSGEESAAAANAPNLRAVGGR